MSRILCPECGTKISNKATKCPHCGFQSADPKRPISEQDKYEMVPIFEYDIEEWQPNRGELSIISYEDNRSLIQYFGKWENIKVKLPAIAEVIGAMAGKDHIMVAKMDSYVKDLIDKGIYRVPSSVIQCLTPHNSRFEIVNPVSSYISRMTESTIGSSFSMCPPGNINPL